LGDDQLVSDGEKYLYGNGVPANCDRAQKNFRTAASHGNARALSMMGTMYATGHCLDRDLPNAYRSFAKALHLEPNNSRIQSDLEILWRQMTPEERQAATHNQ
jgi:TPR repeat protein